MSLVISTFIVACLVSLAIVPLVRRACEKVRLTDRPDGHRKLHAVPVALGGGVAVFISTVAVSFGVFLAGDKVGTTSPQSAEDLVGLLLAGTIILLVGIADDALGLKGRQKLLGQIVACSVPIARGLVIQRLQLFGWTLDLGPLSAPATMLWLLAAINAVNLLDGLNGLATMVGLVDCVAIALLSGVVGHQAHAIAAAAFAGSLLGFLRYNFPQAKLFLGDAGAMLIGMFVGILSINSSLKGPGTVLLAAPLCLMALPLFDSTAAMMRRKLTGRSIFSGDRAHIQHRLADRFGGIRAVGIVSVCCGLTGAAALASVVWKNELVALISGAAIIAVFIISRLFGHAELYLLGARVYATGASFFDYRPRKRATKSSVRIQGSREWAQLWDSLTDAVEQLPVHKVELNVHAPMFQEGFHASWTRPASGPDDTWRFDLPLIVDGHRIGQIGFAGERRPRLPRGDVERILTLCEGFESQLGSIFTIAASDAAPATTERPPLALRTTDTESTIPQSV
jgi:UDP-GlcNAc:undecaprenyl-phosphate/decaprenyl-phosphate GlcNAc-1-phosphate transferase